MNKELERLDNELMREYFCKTLVGCERSGMAYLLKELEKGGFFEAPCSTRYHLCKQGGLLEHSLNVCDTALSLASKLLNEEEFEVMRKSIIICSLLHDVGKIGDHGKPYYKKAELLKSGKEPAKPYDTNKELTNIDHATRSVFIIERYIDLTEEEEYAIMCHDGLYGSMKMQIQGHETKLYMILHWADMWCSHVTEVEKGEEE